MGCQPCHNRGIPSQCPLVFDRVHVSYLIAGGTYVMWDLVPEFVDPLPYTFQLQVGRVGDPLSGEWTNVGLPMENSFYAIDNEQRVFGKTQWTHYRVQLTTPRGSYYSEPTGMSGVLTSRDWRHAREIMRKEKLRARLAAQDGFLLKRRFSGPRCNHCADLQLDESRDPACQYCYGTGYQCGYYYPMPCVWADISPRTKKKEVDAQGGRGTVSDIVVSARMLMIPLLEEYDVWVARRTDDRYVIHRIEDVAEFCGVPVIANVELRPAAYTDILYEILIPEQIQGVTNIHYMARKRS